MGKTYTPTPAHYSEDLMEAKTNAAKYVMNETGLLTYFLNYL